MCKIKWQSQSACSAPTNSLGHRCLGDSKMHLYPHPPTTSQPGASLSLRYSLWISKVQPYSLNVAWPVCSLQLFGNCQNQLVQTTIEPVLILCHTSNMFSKVGLFSTNYNKNKNFNQKVLLTALIRFEHRNSRIPLHLHSICLDI